jgi:hypothetical protein
MKKIICSILFLLFFLSSHQAFSQVLFDGNGLHLKLDNGHLIISTSEKEIVDVSSINFNFTSPKSISILSTNEKEAKLKLVYPGVAEYQGSGEDLIDTISR